MQAFDNRTSEQLLRHYEVEKELADRLRAAPGESRAALYVAIYDELFRRVPDHPQLRRQRDRAWNDAAKAERFALLRPYLKSDATFLEVGAGDCQLALAVASHVRQVYAVEISTEVTRNVRPAPNLALRYSTGTAIPVDSNSVTLAYTYQVIEHLHPEDVRSHLAEIYRVLAAGGRYICVTPNRLCGPHDISRYFGGTARGLHLREYSLTELAALFQAAGFRSVRAIAGFRHHYAEAPLPVCAAVEPVMERLPWRARRRVANAPGIRNLLLAPVIACK